MGLSDVDKIRKAGGDAIDARTGNVVKIKRTASGITITPVGKSSPGRSISGMEVITTRGGSSIEVKTGKIIVTPKQKFAAERLRLAVLTKEAARRRIMALRDEREFEKELKKLKVEAGKVTAQTSAEIFKLKREGFRIKVDKKGKPILENGQVVLEKAPLAQQIKEAQKARGLKAAIKDVSKRELKSIKGDVKTLGNRIKKAIKTEGFKKTFKKAKKQEAQFLISVAKGYLKSVIINPTKANIKVLKKIKQNKKITKIDIQSIDRDKRLARSKDKDIRNFNAVASAAVIGVAVGLLLSVGSPIITTGLTAAAVVATPLFVVSTIRDAKQRGIITAATSATIELAVLGASSRLVKAAIKPTAAAFKQSSKQLNKIKDPKVRSKAKTLLKKGFEKLKRLGKKKEKKVPSKNEMRKELFVLREELRFIKSGNTKARLTLRINKLNNKIKKLKVKKVSQVRSINKQIRSLKRTIKSLPANLREKRGLRFKEAKILGRRDALRLKKALTKEVNLIKKEVAEIKTQTKAAKRAIRDLPANLREKLTVKKRINRARLQKLSNDIKKAFQKNKKVTVAKVKQLQARVRTIKRSVRSLKANLREKRGLRFKEAKILGRRDALRLKKALNKKITNIGKKLNKLKANTKNLPTKTRNRINAKILNLLDTQRRLKLSVKALFAKNKKVSIKAVNRLRNRIKFLDNNIRNFTRKLTPKGFKQELKRQAFFGKQQGKALRIRFNKRLARVTKSINRVKKQINKLPTKIRNKIKARIININSKLRVAKAEFKSSFKRLDKIKRARIAKLERRIRLIEQEVKRIRKPSKTKARKLTRKKHIRKVAEDKRFRVRGEKARKKRFEEIKEDFRLSEQAQKALASDKARLIKFKGGFKIVNRRGDTLISVKKAPGKVKRTAAGTTQVTAGKLKLLQKVKARDKIQLKTLQKKAKKLRRPTRKQALKLKQEIKTKRVALKSQARVATKLGLAVMGRNIKTQTAVLDRITLAVNQRIRLALPTAKSLAFIKSKAKQKAKAKPKAKQKITPKQKQKIRQRQKQKVKQKIIQEQIVRQDQIVRQKVKQKQKVIQRQRLNARQKRILKRLIERLIRRLKLMLLKKKRLSRKDKEELIKWIRKQLRIYRPGLAAILFNITGFRIPRKLTGLEIRPIIVKRPRKKGKKKRRSKKPRKRLKRKRKKKPFFF